MCVATYLRPEGLARLLQAFDRLVFAKSETPELEIIVVDNDPQGSALAVCAHVSGALRWPLRYHHEPRPGISFARNAAVRIAAAAEFVAFIDDDEVPEPQWLDELLYVQRVHEADVVAGPVIPEFPDGAPIWLRRGGFFDLPRYRTGQKLDYTAAGNVLVRSTVFHALNPPFDERLALAGGEDTLFFLRAARAGYLLVWADEALAREYIPRSRVRAGWLLQRAFRVGNSWALCLCSLQPSLRGRAVRVAKGTGRVAGGLLVLPFSPLGGRGTVLRVLRAILFGIGDLAGVVGLRYDEYSRSGRG